jgi:hypothetical protein
MEIPMDCAVGMMLLCSSIFFFLTPFWFRGLWKVKQTFEVFGEKFGKIYYISLAVIFFVGSIYSLIQYFMER